MAAADAVDVAADDNATNEDAVNDAAVEEDSAALELLQRAALSRVKLDISRIILLEMSLPSSKHSLSCLMTRDRLQTQRNNRVKHAACRRLGTCCGIYIREIQ